MKEVKKMKKCIIALSSINYALKSERVLKNENIYTRIIKLQPNRTKNGCAYGLETECADIPYALSFLDNAGIRYSEVLR